MTPLIPPGPRDVACAVCRWYPYLPHDGTACRCDPAALAALLRDTAILAAPIPSIEVAGIGRARLEAGLVRAADLSAHGSHGVASAWRRSAAADAQ